MTKPDKSGWLPIETAPKDETRVLIAGPGLDVTVGWYTQAEPDGPQSMGTDVGWWSENGWSHPGRSFGNPDSRFEAELQPTHWQPLPPPPEDEP